METPPELRPTHRTIPAGEVLVRQGEKIEYVFFVQSGRLLLLQSRGAQLIEIAQITSPQCFGEEAAFVTPARSAVTIMAVRETAVLCVPVAVLREELKNSAIELRELVRGVFERTRAVFNSLKNMRGDRGSVACPPDETARVFASLFHCVRIVDKNWSKGSGSAQADWKSVQILAQDTFGENLARLESAAQILLKLSLAEMEITSQGTEIIRITGMKEVEEFFEFYGNYHFKSGYENLLKTNPKMKIVVETFLRVANAPGSGLIVDRGGVGRIPYQSTVENMKKLLPNFEADQLFRLEQKGLFIKRQATNDGGTLSYLPEDFEQTLRNWRILEEIEIWNEKGYVSSLQKKDDPTRLENTRSPAATQLRQERERWARALSHWKPLATLSGKAPKIRSGQRKLGEIWCPVCMSVCKPRQKICEICGSELQTRAA